MKNILTILLFILGFNSALKSQNSLSVNVEEGLCLTYISVGFDDGSSKNFSLGCSGDYSFNTNTKSATVVFINGVACPLNIETPVHVNDGETALAKLAEFSQTGKHLSVSKPGPRR